MKKTSILLSVIITLSLISSCGQEAPRLNAEEVIHKSIQFHDPNKNWGSLNLKLHIQEPRIQVPLRFSEVYLNQLENTFKMNRSRESHIATYTIDKEGNNTVLLDNETSTDSTQIAKYFLAPERCFSYRKFYQTMYGLPMNLFDISERIEKVEQRLFNSIACHAVYIELKEAVIAKKWIAYFQQDDFSLVGLQFMNEEHAEDSEIIYFDKTITISNVIIPRMRHWYSTSDSTYLGSDIIVTQIQ